MVGEYGKKRKREEKMGKYKLIALDMDGTLLNSKKEISPVTLEMLHRAEAEGKEIVLSTGRGVAELKEYEEKLKVVRYLNGTSGAVVYDWKEKKVVAENPLDPKELEIILDAAKKEDAMVHLFTVEEALIQQSHLDCLEEYQMGIYRKMYETVAKKVENIYAYYAEHPFPVTKCNLYHRCVESRARTEQYLRERGIASAMVHSEITALEFNAAGVNKGTGLLQLCEHLHVSPEEVIAVGDANNDLEVLQIAGLSVAMGNGIEEVKALADVVVADCDHDGCAEAIEKYLL